MRITSVCNASFGKYVKMPTNNNKELYVNANDIKYLEYDKTKNVLKIDTSYNVHSILTNDPKKIIDKITIDDAKDNAIIDISDGCYL